MKLLLSDYRVLYKQGSVLLVGNFSNHGIYYFVLLESQYKDFDFMRTLRVNSPLRVSSSVAILFKYRLQ